MELPGPGGDDRVLPEDRMSIFRPLLRSAAIPSPSPRCTETNSRPSESISTLSSVWVPSKSSTTASMSSAVGSEPGRSASNSGANARALASSWGRRSPTPVRGRSGRVRCGRRSGGRPCGSQPRPCRRRRRSPGSPGAVLAARAERLVVVDAVTAAGDRRVGDLGGASDLFAAGGFDDRRGLVVGVAPDEAVEGRDGVRGVGAVRDDRVDDAVDVLADDEGAGALHEQDHVDGRAVQRLVGVHGVQDGGLGGRGVTGDGGGPQHDLGAGLAGGGGDGLVVGGDHDIGHQPAGAALAHGAGHQRYAADGGEVLGGDALGAAARGDHREHPAHRSALARLRVGHGLYSLSGSLGVHSSPSGG